MQRRGTGKGLRQSGVEKCRLFRTQGLDAATADKRTQPSLVRSFFHSADARGHRRPPTAGGEEGRSLPALFLRQPRGHSVKLKVLFLQTCETHPLWCLSLCCFWRRGCRRSRARVTFGLKCKGGGKKIFGDGKRFTFSGFPRPLETERFFPRQSTTRLVAFSPFPPSSFRSPFPLSWRWRASFFTGCPILHFFTRQNKWQQARFSAGRHRLPF